MGRVLAAEPPARDADVVRMSPYEVSAASVEFEKWLKIGSPHFLLYTDAKPEEAEAVLRECELMLSAAQRYFRRKVLKLPRLILVMPTSESDWIKIASKAPVEWRIAVSHHSGSAARLILVQYNWQGWLAGMSSVRAALGVEIVHAMNLKGPLWFNVGIGRFLGETIFRDDSVALGRRPVRASTMWMRGWIPWGTFFKVTEKSSEYLKKKEIVRFDGQSSAFVHYLLTDPNPIGTERLLSWVARLNAGTEPTEEEFKKVFEQDWTSWQETMRQQRKKPVRSQDLIRYSAVDFDVPVTRSELSVREMRELFVLSQIIAQRGEVSDTALDALLARGLKTAALRPLLVEACFAAKRESAALEQLRKIIAEGQVPAAIYAAAAAQRFKMGVPEISLDARIGDERDEIRDWCEQALAGEPRLDNAGRTLAWVEALDAAVTPDNIAAIKKIHEALLRDVTTVQIVCAWAVAKWRAGDIAGADKLARAVAASPYANKKDKELVAALSARIGSHP